MIEQTCKLNLKGFTYETKKVSMATLFQIDQLKLELSNGNYGAMIRTGTVGMNKTLDYIDMSAALIALMPKEFFENLKTPNKNLLELHPSDAKELFEAYSEQMQSWVVSVCNLLKGD